jgi:hypothetical protein
MVVGFNPNTVGKLVGELDSEVAWSIVGISVGATDGKSVIVDSDPGTIVEDGVCELSLKNT